MRAYERLNAEEKLALLMLTSDVKAEYMRAAAIQHRIYCEALEAAGRPAFHLERKWWSWQVQFNVSRHMGWLAKAQSMGVLKKCKTRGGGLNLGQMGSRYRIMPFTEKLARKYKEKAVLTTALAQMPTPRTFVDYQANRKQLLGMPSNYHDLFYFRAFFELERQATFGTLEMPLGNSVTIKEFAQVFPDSVGHLKASARHFGSNTVVTVLKRLGYTSQGLPASLATMHLCFIGQLHTLKFDVARRVRKTMLKRATRKHRLGTYCGHPLRVWGDACKMVASS